MFKLDQHLFVFLIEGEFSKQNKSFPNETFHDYLTFRKQSGIISTVIRMSYQNISSKAFSQRENMS